MLTKRQVIFIPFVSLVAFILILALVAINVVSIDLTISSKITGLWGSLSNQIFIFIGHFLKPLLVTTGLALIFVLYKQERKKDSLILFISLATGYILEQLVKILIQRPRPPIQLIEKASYSFPSGHAIFAAILFTFLVYSYKDKIKNNLQKIVFVSLGIILILFVGFSRIYMNVHWFTDVMGGFFLGFFILSSILFLVQKIEKI